MQRRSTVALAIAVTAACFVTTTSARSFTCSPGPYLIFFDAAAAYVAPEAFEILGEAQQRLGSCGSGTVVIAAHTDTKENPALAKKRMEVVRAYWVAHGVPRDDISAKAFGATRPRVLTGPNVSEPRNRRVEITFGPLALGIAR